MRNNLKEKSMLYSRRGFLVVLILISGLLFAWQELRAASYDYYVKEGEDGDGSEGDPFGSIADALEEAKEHGRKKIFVFDGSYSAAITLSKDIELTGSDTDDVTITGKIRMEDGSNLEELTVEIGGIITASNADVTISDVRIVNVLDVGIKGEEGHGTITVRNSAIEKSRKGMYFQRGNEIRIEDVEVIDNKEEGIDIRPDVSGSIKKSVFRDNDESGIELILGSADLLIASNIFSGNGASGIATQFYDGEKKTGDVRIENNSISGSSNYGIDCKAPQGGLESKDYYLNSISVIGNKFSKNKEGDIAKNCRVLTDEQRITLEEKNQVAFDQVLSPAEFAERVQQDAAARKEYDDAREALEREAVEGALGQVAGFLSRAESAKEEFKERGAVQCFFFGEDAALKQSLRSTATDMTPLLERLRTESLTLAFDTNRQLVEETLAAQANALEMIEDEIALSSCDFSIFGRLNAFLANMRDEAHLVSSEELALSLFPVSEERQMLFVGSIGYASKNRSQVIRLGDASPFTDLKDTLRAYDQVTGTLTSPMLDEADPAPLQNSATPLSLPARFANVLATHNIRLLHLGGASPMRTSGEKGYGKTAVNMELAGIETFGGLNTGGVLSRTVSLEGVPITVLEYRESKTTDPEGMVEAIAEAKETSRAIAVFITYDPALSLALTEERKTYARRFVEAGALLVIGTGIPIVPQSEILGSSRIYYSLGNFWGGTGVAPGDGLAIALTLPAIASEGALWKEQVVSWNEDGKIILTPKE
jgi:hypothetical protein